MGELYNVPKQPKHFKKINLKIHSNWKLTFSPSAEKSPEQPAGLDVSERLVVFHMFPKIQAEQIMKCISYSIINAF